MKPFAGYRGDASLSGEVALRKNANGVVEVVGVQSLHCSDCSNSNCTHLGYSVRQTAYIAQGILTPTPNAATGRTPGVRRQPNPETGLPVSLENHCTVTRDEEGRRTVRFNQVDESRRNGSLARLARDVTADAFIEETPELYHIVTHAPNPNHLARGLRNLEDGETMVVPISSEFRTLVFSSLNTANLASYVSVTGAITYGRDDEGNPVVRERSLRCACDVYARNYSCRHTRRVEAGEMGLVASLAVQEGIQRAGGNHPGIEDQAELRTFTGAAAVQDREALIGRTLTLEEASVIADNERNLSYGESSELRDQYRRELESIRAARQRREELIALAGYTEQREKMAARLADFQGPRYSEDYAAFEAEVEAVKAKIAAGEDPHTFETSSNVLNGIGDDTDRARKFGVEIEVVFPNGSTASQKAAVARALKEAGLSDRGAVGGYHSGASNGWAKWTAENDCTVDLEVVSPLMSDTPEHWAQLQKVCDIIKANGGQADMKTGSHVHISTGDYGSSVTSHAALIDEFSRYSDILYRLGSNPETKTHRGRQWCRPNVLSHEEVSDADVRSQYGTSSRYAVSSYLRAPHSSAVNLEASGQGTKSHAEIRIWDGSVSPAHIQMQVMLTAAMTEKAAQRTAGAESDTFAYSPMEEHMILGTGRNTTYSSKEAETAKFREMLDRYFPREADRKKFIALWETTKWQ